MKRLAIIAALFVIGVQPIGLFADDGMWTFDNPPLKQWKEQKAQLLLIPVSAVQKLVEAAATGGTCANGK